MKKNVLFISGIIAIISVSIIIGMITSNPTKAQSMSYIDFMNNVNNHQVAQVVIKNEETLVVTMKDKTTYNVSNPSKDDLKETLLLQGIDVETKTSTDLSGLISSIFILLVVVAIILYSRKGLGENKQLIKDVNKNNINTDKTIKFEDVAGNYEAKEMVKDVIEFIKNPEKYHKLGAKMPRGLLLYGLPGTGKTLMAKAIAGEANVPFFAMSGSDFVQMYVGVGANRIRQLFKSARKSEKAVIFIDEIDALGKSRSGKASASNDEREQTLNALLTEMSGFNSSEGIVVIGATNRADTLDQALLRPGRFDRQIEVTLPDQIAREEILKLYLKDKPLSEDVDITKLSNNTVLFSGAMLENLVNEAAILAANQGSEIISDKHLDKALYTVIAGMDKKNSDVLIKQEEKEITAYHEAGHAIVTRLLLPENKLAKVTIIPTTKGAAGYNYNIPKDKMFKRKGELLSNIKVLLAGRATEALIYGEDDVTTGAINDIKVASEEIYQFFHKYGMDEEHGLFSLEISNALDQQIYDQCRDKMKVLYGETKALISKYQVELEKTVELLLEKETITGEDIDLILENA